MRERKTIAAPKETPIRAAAHAPRPAARRSAEPRAPRAAAPHPAAIAPFTITPKPDPRGGTPIDDTLRRGEEARTGADLRPVRLHQDSQSVRAAEAHSARALTVGEHVYAGRSAPDLQRTPEGQSILRHELQHVLEARRDPSLRETPLRLPEDQLILQMEQHIAKNNVAAALDVLRNENKFHQFSVGVRGAISNFLTHGQFTPAQAWRAVALQIHGTEAQWPVTTRNFVEGLDAAVFIPPPGMPPASGPELQQVAIQTSTAPTLSNTDFDRYRTKFDSMWHLPQFTGPAMSAEFDPAMDSRGPRNRKARAIFDEILLTDTTVRTAYLIGGVTRRKIDTYIGPESMNPNASLRLERLRRALTVPPVAAVLVTDPDYATLKSNVRAVAQNLDSPDRQAFQSAHEWRLQIERVVAPDALRRDLRTTILTAWTTRPAPVITPPTTAPTPTSGTTAPPVTPPLALTADQQTFVNDLRLTVPVAAKSSQTETTKLTFNPASSRNPAGLTVSSRVEVTPPDVVREGQVTENAWPAAAVAGAAHEPIVETEGTGPTTAYTGSLTVVPGSGTIAQTPRTAIVSVKDDREAFFAANSKLAMIYSDQNRRWYLKPGATPPIAYYGGTLTIMILPILDSNLLNPGLTVFVGATLTRGGSLLHTFPRGEFGRNANALNVGSLNVMESVPASATPDAMECLVEYFRTDTGGTAFHSLRHVFSVSPGTAFTNADVLKQLKDDHKLLNDKSSSGYFAKMKDPAFMGARVGVARALADAVVGGNVQIEPMMIRADSAAYLRSKHEPLSQVAYARGHTVINDAKTSIAGPGADGFRTSDDPRGVYINLTLSLANPTKKRDTREVINFMIHEGIHALDYPRVSSVTIERYKREFRAYWIGGEHDVDPATSAPYKTAYEPSMDERGPKSRKARAIFMHLYGSASYPYVKPSYDANTDHFREQVNAIIIPDGINLVVSHHLDNLRTEIEGYAGTDFAAHRAKVVKWYDATGAPERQEMRGNPIWRELLKTTYKNTTEYDDIRTLLGVPK